MQYLTDIYHQSISWPVMCIMLISSFTMAQDHHHGHQEKTHIDHSQHAKALNNPHVELKERLYPIEDVQLVDQNNRKLSLTKILSQDKPIALNFIFTTCTTICPVMTATFSQMHQQLDKSTLQQLQTVSISIDPQYDQPKELYDYAKRFNADKSWLFLTGSDKDITHVLKSFDVYTGSKLNHRPVALFRKKNSDRWLRVEGLASGQDLVDILEHKVLNP